MRDQQWEREPKTKDDSWDPKPVPPPRIYGIVAREAPICVIFRRGPSDRVQTLQWNTETDEITAGQWFSGRIYEKRGDLSPDGKYMAYFAAKRSDQRPPERQTYTVISRTPFLRALSLWWKGDSWGGGALFESADHVLLNDPEWAHRASFVEDKEHPCPVKTSLLGAPRGEDWPIEAIRLERDGWVFQEKDGRYLMDRPIDGFQLRMNYIFGGSKYSYFDRSGVEHPLTDWEWADVDCHGSVLGAKEGKLLKARPADVLEGQLSEIADLSPHRFERVQAPDWAREWCSEE